MLPYVFKKGGHICLLSAMVRLLCRIVKFAKAYIEYPDKDFVTIVTGRTGENKKILGVLKDRKKSTVFVSTYLP